MSPFLRVTVSLFSLSLCHCVPVYLCLCVSVSLCLFDSVSVCHCDSVSLCVSLPLLWRHSTVLHSLSLSVSLSLAQLCLTRALVTLLLNCWVGLLVVFVRWAVVRWVGPGCPGDDHQCGGRECPPARVPRFRQGRSHRQLPRSPADARRPGLCGLHILRALLRCAATCCVAHEASASAAATVLESLQRQSSRRQPVPKSRN